MMPQHVMWLGAALVAATGFLAGWVTGITHRSKLDGKSIELLLKRVDQLRAERNEAEAICNEYLVSISRSDRLAADERLAEYQRRRFGG